MTDVGSTVTPSDESPGPEASSTRDEGRPTATILVVEDEDALRRLVTRMLGRMGYATLEAADGVAGLAAAREAGGDLDLVLTDVVMPRLNGPDMAAELRKEGSRVPVAFMSGYSGEALAGADRHTHFLAKPFTMDELEAFVASLLEKP